VTGYSGDAGDALTTAPNPDTIANGMMFSTPDSDNDASPDHCAAIYGRAWWDRSCSNSCLNKSVQGKWNSDNLAGNDVQDSHMLVKLNY